MYPGLNMLHLIHRKEMFGEWPSDLEQCTDPGKPFFIIQIYILGKYFTPIDVFLQDYLFTNQGSLLNFHD